MKRIKLLLVLLLACSITGCINSGDSHSHHLIRIARKEPTCYQDGNIEYYKCTDCKKFYKDVECTIELTNVSLWHLEHKMHLVPQVDPTSELEGTKEHFECEYCKDCFLRNSSQEYYKVNSSDLVIPSLGNKTVTFDYEGIPSQTVPYNGLATEPSTIPTRPSGKDYSYTFAYWMLNNQMYDFSTPVTDDIILVPYFVKVAIEYQISFHLSDSETKKVSFTCETKVEDFKEPSVPYREGYEGRWTDYSINKLENQDVYPIYQIAGGLQAPTLEKYDGYTLRFKVVDHAVKYKVYDDNDYRSEVVLYQKDADKDGYLYYTTEVVGKHNVSVEAISDTNETSRSLTIRAIENKLVFPYGNFTPVLFHDMRENPPASEEKIYTCKMADGTVKYVTQSDFNSNYILNQNGLVDYTKNGQIDAIMQDMKALGVNVIDLNNRFVNIENFATWWFGSSFETSVCKRTMDAAWKVGIKCIVADFQILNKSTDSGAQDTIRSRMLSSAMKAAAKHPAFYGIELEDEPMPGEEMSNACSTVKTILDVWHTDSDYKKLPDPVIHTDLCSFNRNENSDPNADPYLFADQAAYQNYLESWVTGTGLDYLFFDYYTYTTYIYGQKSKSGNQIYYDSTKVIYDSIHNLQETYDGLTIHQTITASNYKNRMAVTYNDVFGQMLLITSQGNEGYSIWTYSQANPSNINNCTDMFFNKNTTFTWVEEANKQYKKLQYLLDGYEVESRELSTYSYRFSITDSGIGYGFGERNATSTFKNVAGKTCQMVVNYNSYTTDAPVKVSVPANSTYYLLGYNNFIKKTTSSKLSVSLSNGQGILIF